MMPDKKFINYLNWKLFLSFLLVTAYQIAFVPTSVFAIPSSAITSNNSEAVALFREAGNILNTTKDLHKAAALLKRACELDPSCAVFHNNYGLVLLNLEQSDAAKEEFLKAIALHKDFAPPWENLGTIYENRGQLDDAAAAFEEYLRLDPNNNSPDAQNIRYHLAMYKSEKPTGSGPDYYSSLSKAQTAIWPRTKMPIKIYMEAGESVPGFKPQYQELVHKAFLDWAVASEGKLSFVFIPNKDGADIITKWSDNPNSLHSSLFGGAETGFEASMGPDGATLNKITITILTTDPLPLVKISDNIVYRIALHEVGHAIGIMGHSPNPDDIMYFSTKSYLAKPELSIRDKNTLLKLYALDH